MKNVALVVALVVTACSATRVYAPDQVAGTPSGSVAPVPSTRDYVLSNSDKVRVTVYNEPTLSGEFGIDPAGQVSLPLIGQVQARGLTAPLLSAAIQTKLADGYLRDPKVAVEVLTYRPFYVLGEVNHAGEFPYTEGMTVLQAIASAQGFTYRAAKRYVFLKRAGQAEETRVPLTSTLAIGPGDTVRVGERYF